MKLSAESAQARQPSQHRAGCTRCLLMDGQQRCIANQLLGWLQSWRSPALASMTMLDLEAFYC